MNDPSRVEITLGALFALTGIMAGAFGAHGLEEQLAAREATGAWQTGVLYHLIHALALLSLGIWTRVEGRSAARSTAGACWSGGIVLFSGSLYVLALGGPGLLGPVTPLGGLLFMAGWVALLPAAWKKPAA